MLPTGYLQKLCLGSTKTERLFVFVCFVANTLGSNKDVFDGL